MRAVKTEEAQQIYPDTNVGLTSDAENSPKEDRPRFTFAKPKPPQETQSSDENSRKKSKVKRHAKKRELQRPSYDSASPPDYSLSSDDPEIAEEKPKFSFVQRPEPTDHGPLPPISVCPLDQDWSEAYAADPDWKDFWQDCNDPEKEWPENFRLTSTLGHWKLIRDGRICVPISFAPAVMASLHVQTGHLGVGKTVMEWKRRYNLTSNLQLIPLAKKIKRTCPICQACEPPNWQIKGPISPNPVPPHVFDSVCLDIFSMPPVVWQLQYFDCMVLCVDRLSSWIIARPTQKEGLTAEKTAHLILDHGWNEIGIPSLVTSDQGPQFIGQYWKTLCSRLGIRHAYSQAHRPDANGMAEKAGNQIISRLRKLNAEKDIN